MGEWKIKLYASDMPDDPTNGSADEGEYEFNILSIMPTDEPIFDVERKADSSLDNRIGQRAVLTLEFLPFYVKTSFLSNQQSANDLMILKKMLRQPYLVIKSTTLPLWADGASHFNSEYPLPALVRWDYEETSASNKEDGTIELPNVRLEYMYPKGVTQPTPITSTNTYAY